jgi:hypothetical protein
VSETGERIFRHLVPLTIQGNGRRVMREWCAQQFGESDAVLLRYSLGLNSAGMRLGVYRGAGSWAFSMTSANFERSEDAFAFKLRWG